MLKLLVYVLENVETKCAIEFSGNRPINQIMGEELDFAGIRMTLAGLLYKTRVQIRCSEFTYRLSDQRRTEAVSAANLKYIIHSCQHF